MSRQSELAELSRIYDSSALSNRNLIINGAMTVAQRGTSTTGIVSSGFYSVDRVYTQTLSLGTWTESQDTNAPSGFSNSFKVLCTTADASPAAGDYKFATHRIEAQNLQQLSFGTSEAKAITLSFWVKSNKTGTYTTSLQNFDASRQIGYNYTINSADTWEKKVITFDGDASGAIDNNNGIGLQIDWWLGSGTNWNSSGAPLSSWAAQDNTARNGGSTVNLADAVNNYWQITGVQLEVGDTATPFEHRSYGDELARCQRYFVQLDAGSVSDYAVSGVTQSVSWFFPVSMRAAPTVVTKSGSSIYAGTDGISTQHVTVYNTSGNTARIANGEQWGAEL